jgi:hypothetical protein
MPEVRPAGMGNSVPSAGNPLTSISAGYEQLRTIVQSVIQMAEQTPWYVWAAIAVLLVVKEKRGDE